MKIGVCYYPEHWDRTQWASDAEQMVKAGISVVRIGEFAWSRLEPQREAWEFEWLDEAIATLGNAGLKVILGTPTATPPKWLIDEHPEILAVDSYGRPRRFGSRRHYCFSSPAYAKETIRIVTRLAQRYGEINTVIAWQTDNEYGCHDTVRSYSPAATLAFRQWLNHRYGDIAALNAAWGTVFWSQEYQRFDQIDLPNLTVTEPNPSHVLDFYRFSSDQVIAYNRLQTDIVRKFSPGRDIYHNFMGHFTDFDHFALSRDIDVASWDSYPLGFLVQENYQRGDQETYLRQGHPDFAGFHHELYRACGLQNGQRSARWAVMEQQPGPVNWAPSNPAPLKGMVRLWGHEVRGHGGEMVSYFRWRQAPFAQENLHAGLLRFDGASAQGLGEVHSLSDEVSKTAALDFTATPARVALVFDYDTQWMSQIKPQGEGWDYFRLAMRFFESARSLGLGVNIVPPGASLEGYDIVLVPSLIHLSEAAMDAFKSTKAQIVFGPRMGTMSECMHMVSCAWAPLMPIEVTRSESFPAWFSQEGEATSKLFSAEDVYITDWLDHVETQLVPLATVNGHGIIYQHANKWMIAGVPTDSFLKKIMHAVCGAALVPVTELPEGVRLHHGETKDGEQVLQAVNYSAQSQTLPPNLCPQGAQFLVGSAVLDPADIAIWKMPQS